MWSSRPPAASSSSTSSSPDKPLQMPASWWPSRAGTLRERPEWKSTSRTTFTFRSSNGSSAHPTGAASIGPRGTPRTRSPRAQPAGRRPNRCGAPCSSRRSRSAPTQAELIATVALTCLIASFGSALFGQNVDPLAKSFGVSNPALGVSRAITRAGILFALVATALADRRGRRVVLLGALGAVCFGSLISAVAPNIEVFTGAQLIVRAAVNAVLVVGGIAVVEEAPEGARAFAVAMLGLAAGAGFALSVVILPAADLGPEAWRGAFAVERAQRAPDPGHRPPSPRDPSLRSARGAVRGAGPGTRARGSPLPAPARPARVDRLPGQRLQRALRAVHEPVPRRRARLLAVGDRRVPSRHRGPSGTVRHPARGADQRDRGRRSGRDRRACSSGRSARIVFFLGYGAVLWIFMTVAIVAAAPATLAIGTLDAELFPTEIRGTSNALLLVTSVLGSVARAGRGGSALRLDRRPRQRDRALRHRAARRRDLPRPPPSRVRRVSCSTTSAPPRSRMQA